MKTSYVRMFADSAKFKNGQVYQLTTCDTGRKRLTPMFGRYKGPAYANDVMSSTLDALEEDDKMEYVTPMLRTADRSLHFYHVVGNTVVWINEVTSGAMPDDYLYHFQPCNPAYPC